MTTQEGRLGSPSACRSHLLTIALHRKHVFLLNACRLLAFSRQKRKCGTTDSRRDTRTPVREVRLGPRRRKQITLHMSVT
uniref:Uncharacterized protein n=1 Tax=Rangifer tarandus platyrhynchus TaxID=3082113 RepID=A0ACB0E2W5_RANTA|nr:unnamed protein product [Rangifer tarandus platyrhynchus]